MLALNRISSRDQSRSFSGVFCGLFRRRQAEPDPVVIALRDARAKREAAMADYRDAKAVGDTRRMHEAHRSVRHATTEVVRLELGR